MWNNPGFIFDHYTDGSSCKPYRKYQAREYLHNNPFSGYCEETDILFINLSGKIYGNVKENHKCHVNNSVTEE